MYFIPFKQVSKKSQLSIIRTSEIKQQNYTLTKRDPVHTYVNYTFIFKKSFKYLKNFNETAADKVGSTYFQIVTAPF